MTPPFIDHSSGMWNFWQTDRLDSVVSSWNQKGNAMRKILVALATVAALAFSSSAPAHAQRYLGAAIAGGLIGGAIVGGAVAANPYYYGPGPPSYGPRPSLGP